MICLVVPPSVRFARLAAAAALLFVVVACVPSRANVSIADLERAFPLMTGLGLSTYEYRVFNEGEPVCESIRYSRGFFSSIPDSTTCGSFSDDPPDNARAFDDGANADLQRLKAALSAVAPVDQQSQVRVDLVDGAVGPGSWFLFDGCVTYFYEPGWTNLPESIAGRTVSKAISSDWHLVDVCT